MVEKERVDAENPVAIVNYKIDIMITHTPMDELSNFNPVLLSMGVCSTPCHYSRQLSTAVYR